VVGLFIYPVYDEWGGYNFHYYPALWKNGDMQILSDFSGDNNFEINDPISVAVSGNDVYIMGHGVDYTSMDLFPGVWKNNKLLHIPANHENYYTVLRSLRVHNDDVYLAGSVQISPDYPFGVAAYWKNGEIMLYGKTPIFLANEEFLSIVVFGVFVYTSAWAYEDYNRSDLDYGIIRKNREVLFKDYGTYGASTYSIFVSDK
jgi:hypothetical protein